MGRLWLAAVAVLLAACAGLPPPEASPGKASEAPPGEALGRPGEAAFQSLFRVRYEGPDGAGSLRLVQRQVAPERFQLQAADTFGRAVWSLDLDGGEVLLVDHRRRRACLSGGELRVPEVALRPLPLPAVARVLGSRTPLDPPAGADPEDWTDAAGQRWTSRWEEGELAAWMLWQEGEPQLWWSRLPGGGVLSHRDGSQFRWRRTAREELDPTGYRRLEAPEGYELGECEATELRSR